MAPYPTSTHEIQIQTSRADKPTAKVTAHVFGEWAAHPGVEHDLSLRLDWWVVTHVPNGRSLHTMVGQLDELTAIAVARALGERAGGLLPVFDPLKTERELEMNPRLQTARKVIKSVVFDVLGDTWALIALDDEADEVML